MGSRRETPDVLAEVMGASNKTVNQENTKEIEHEKGGTTITESGKTLIHESLAGINTGSNKSGEMKEKTTFNLSVSTLEKLEDTWMILRRKLKDKGRITKTLIVERAIELALKELQENGSDSALFQDLANQ